MPLNRFIANNNTYTFPSTLEAYSTNFGDVVTRTTRLPGVDGGFDEYLSDIAAREIGTIRQAFTLQSETKSGLDALRNEVDAMLGWGKGVLYYRPTNYPTDPERRVYCRVSNIQMSRNEGDARTQYWQRVTVIFQASAPIWEVSAPTNGGGSYSGDEQDYAVTNNGNAIALPFISVGTGPGDIVSNPWGIQRLVGNDVVDEMIYYYDLPSDSSLVFDCGASTIDFNNGTEGYDNTFEFIHPDWLRLLPGANLIRVFSADVDDEASFIFQFRDTYY